VLFSKSVAPVSATNLANYALQGGASPTIVRAVVSNSSTIILNLSGPRTTQVNYNLTVQNVTDTAYLANKITPNPTNLPVWMQIDLLTINGTAWKYFQPTNNVMDSQPWKTPSFDDRSWSNGFGIFYGNRTNSPWQPNPNPGVILPFSLSSSDPNNTRVFTILDVFTNAANAIRTYTYYFRSTFNLPAETNGVYLRIHSMIDDGAIMFINGQEVRRDRMSSGTATFTTLASSSGNQSWSPSLTATGLVATVGNLVKGQNTIAVEVHQRTATDDDVTFGYYLEAVIPGFAPVGAMQILPAGAGNALAGNWTSPSSAQDPGDLVITWEEPNGVVESATSLTGEWTEWKGGSPLIIHRADIQNSPVRFFRLRWLLPPPQTDPALTASGEPDPVPGEPASTDATPPDAVP
jgi:hypothetical protein